MVEDVLKQDSPKQDFAERVFQLLNLHDGEGRRRWADRHAMKLELSRIADEGLGGFFRALELPHARSRSFAMGMIGASKVQITEELIAMIKRCLKDSNKKVRPREGLVTPGGARRALTPPGRFLYGCDHRFRLHSSVRVL